jgi:hypothetical protein
MSTVNAFTPRGQTYLVTTSDVQIKTQDNANAISYRIRNLSTNTAYFGWKPADPTGAAVAVGTVTIPTAGSPSQNVIGMFPESVEVFTLPPNVWLKSDTANAFEVIAGEGL